MDWNVGAVHSDFNLGELISTKNPKTSKMGTISEISQFALKGIVHLVFHTLIPRWSV